MKSNLDTVRGKLGSVTQKITKGTRRVATATTLAVASLASQAQNPPAIPEIPTASVEKQNTYNAMLSEGAKIGGKSVSGQTELFYSLQTSPGNYVVDVSQWNGLSLQGDKDNKAKYAHLDGFLRSLVNNDPAFSQKKEVFIGVSEQAYKSLNVQIPEGVVKGYKVYVVYLSGLQDDGNKITVSVKHPDNGKFQKLDGKVYDYEHTKSRLLESLGGKQEVIEAIDSHPLRTVGAVSAGALGVLALGGLAGAGLAGRGRKKEVELWEERSKGKGFQIQLDELLRLDGIAFERNTNNGVYTFSLQNRVYHLRSEYLLEEGGNIILESHGQYLKDDGQMHVIRGAGGNLPKVSLEVFAGYINNQLEMGGPLTEPAPEGDMQVISEVVLRHVEIDDLPLVSNKLLGAIQRIDELISQTGRIGSYKLRFLHAGESGMNTGSRICSFNNGIKECEIYINPEGLVQITIDGVNIPNDHDVGELKDLEPVLKSIFED